MAPDGEVRPMSLGDLARMVMDRAASSPRRSARFVLGIAGPPAAGKSTLSVDLRDAVNERAERRIAEVAPMDGFHMTNAQLEASGLLMRKGEPDTFDAVEYGQRLQRVRSEAGVDVPWPAYDRRLHDPVPDGLVFTSDVRIVITEGNYLFLDSGAWAEVRASLDDAWFLDADLDLVERRLMERHCRGGKTDAAARRKTTVSDMPNAQLVVESKHNARVVICESEGTYWVTSMTDSQIGDPSACS